MGILGVSAIGVFIHVVAMMFDVTTRLTLMYTRNQFYAFAMFLCFIQLMDFLSFHHLFGPWAIIIREMMKDLVLFLLVLVIFLLGFTFQMAAVYLPMTAPPPDVPDFGDGDGSGGVIARTPIATFEVLFFSLFGIVDPQNMPPLSRHPWWSITLAKAILGVFLIITVIMLINLLIAMMSDTYQEIEGQSDIEWKFGRAKLFRNMNKTSSTPAPVNLITKLITYCKILRKHGSQCTLTTGRRWVGQCQGHNFPLLLVLPSVLFRDALKRP